MIHVQHDWVLARLARKSGEPFGDQHDNQGQNNDVPLPRGGVHTEIGLDLLAEVD
jgi:hypothetical protein